MIRHVDRVPVAVSSAVQQYDTDLMAIHARHESVITDLRRSFEETTVSRQTLEATQHDMDRWGQTAMYTCHPSHCLSVMHILHIFVKVTNLHFYGIHLYVFI